MNGEAAEMDLYAILNLDRTASKAEIKKAYHKYALSNHPDKVPQEERDEAEIRFKDASRAYEILYDEQTRNLYDTHGMAAFEKGAGGPAGMDDINDMFAQMFGMGGGMGGMGGMPGMGGMGGRPQRPRKGRSEEHIYEVSLEELYKGKTTKFASTKNTICSHCGGTGGKEKAKPKQCEDCKGQGLVQKLQQVGPGMVSQVTVNCSTCNGAGQFYKEKDRCKKCKGKRTTQEKKMLELYIPRGSREGERIVLAGEGDQHPDQEPGDIIFELKEKDHPTFGRAGADLSADLEITLSEALTGFSRVVLTHLDGRGLQMSVKQPKGKVLRPDQILKIPGEGMPYKRSDSKGDLYLVVKIQFPEDGWLSDEQEINKVRELLPKPAAAIKAEEVDEVEYEEGHMEDFGAGSGDPRSGAEWEDEDDEGGGAQCAQQ